MHRIVKVSTPNKLLDHQENSTHGLEEGIRAAGPNIADVAHSQRRDATEEAKIISVKFMIYFDTYGRLSCQNR